MSYRIQYGLLAYAVTGAHGAAAIRRRPVAAVKMDVYFDDKPIGQTVAKSYFGPGSIARRAGSIRLALSPSGRLDDAEDVKQRAILDREQHEFLPIVLMQG